MEVPSTLAEKLAELGLARTTDRRHWRLEGTEILLEAPSAQLDRDAVVTEIKRTARNRPHGTPSRVLS